MKLIPGLPTGHNALWHKGFSLSPALDGHPVLCEDSVKLLSVKKSTWESRDSVNKTEGEKLQY